LRASLQSLWSGAFVSGTDLDQTPPSLDAVRARLDAIDAELLKLVDERAGLARVVAAAKAAAGSGGRFGLRPAREAQLMRKLLAHPRKGASDALTVRIWRELIADSLAQQGPYSLAVWGGDDPARAVELARQQFGAAPPLTRVNKPEEAIAAAKTNGCVAVLPIAGAHPWWGRLLAEPTLAVFAALPCLSVWGPVSALAVAEVAIEEPSGDDVTFWVTDAAEPGPVIEEKLSHDSVAADLIAQGGGLKLFMLAGFYQRHDARLARAPGRLTGVIGAAARQFDL
jgi:chorismate mutase